MCSVDISRPARNAGGGRVRAERKNPPRKPPSACPVCDSPRVWCLGPTAWESECLTCACVAPGVLFSNLRGAA